MENIDFSGIYLIFLFFILFIVITTILDIKTDYSEKFIKSVMWHDPKDSGEKIVVKYWVWERNKKKYIEKLYCNGSIVYFNGANYLVNHLYKKCNPRRKTFFVLEVAVVAGLEEKLEHM